MFSNDEKIAFNNNREPGPASKYVKKEFFDQIHTSQITLPRNNGGYDGILNEEGEKLLAAIEFTKFKDTFYNYFIGGYPSGRFFNSAGVYTDAYNNRIIRGTLASTGHTVESNIIVIYSNTWALTASGSLYKLQ
jgi:hypothetical protein